MKKRKHKKRYGMNKLTSKKKSVWLSEQNKHGWSLGLALNDRTIWLTNTRFASRKDVENTLNGKAKVVFINLKGK